MDAANKAMADGVKRSQTCNKNDNVETSTLVTVTGQFIPPDIGDAVNAFKVTLGQKTGPPNSGYVMLVRRGNVLVTTFYMNKAGSDDIDQVLKITRTAAR